MICALNIVFFKGELVAENGKLVTEYQNRILPQMAAAHGKNHPGPVGWGF